MRWALPLVAIAAPACSVPAPMGSEPAVLTSTAPTAELRLPTPGTDRLLIEVTRVENPAGQAISLAFGTVGGEPIERVSLYPPDQPANFGVRVPRETAALVVRMEATDASSPVRIELRARPQP